MLFPTLNILFFQISTYRSTCAVRNMAVFCISLISRFPAMLFNNFMNDFDTLSFAPVMTFIFTFHIHCFSVVINHSVFINQFHLTIILPMLNLLHLFLKFRIVAIFVIFDIDETLCTYCIRAFIICLSVKFRKPRRPLFHCLTMRIQ